MILEEKETEENYILIPMTELHFQVGPDSMFRFHIFCRQSHRAILRKTNNRKRRLGLKNVYQTRFRIWGNLRLW